MEMSVILTMLAVLQNNEYITQEGNAKVYNLKAWSRASKAYVLKKRTIYDKVSFRKAILKEVEDNIASRTLLPLDLSSRHVARGDAGDAQRPLAEFRASPGGFL